VGKVSCRYSEGSLYWTQCICRSGQGKPITLTLKEAPPGVTVTISPSGDNASRKVVRVEWQPSKDRANRGGGQAIRLLAGVGTKEHTLEIPLLLQAPSPP
jgi:hypothetical protein